MMRSAQVALLAALPGLSHGFEQRLASGGRESRDETRARVSAALAADGRLYLLSQVHGREVRRAPWHGSPEADAGFSSEPGVLLGIESADCLPVLLADPARRAAAAAHAGWRGSAQGVTLATVRALLAEGSRARDLVAALGPAIGPCCYEVGDELRAHFGPGEQELFRSGPVGRPRLDLRELNRRQLLAAGLLPERIESLAECTRCRADLYHSFRREGSPAGRMISWVGWRL
ncbi:MAG: peptidoglycan editing factor PgeF [Vicinamibacteria bacterium]